MAWFMIIFTFLTYLCEGKLLVLYVIMPDWNKLNSFAAFNMRKCSYKHKFGASRFKAALYTALHMGKQFSKSQQYAH